MSSPVSNESHDGVTHKLPPGRLVVFWAWMGIIVVGLTIMIVVPLSGA